MPTTRLGSVYFTKPAHVRTTPTGYKLMIEDTLICEAADLQGLERQARRLTAHYLSKVDPVGADYNVRCALVNGVDWHQSRIGKGWPETYWLHAETDEEGCLLVEQSGGQIPVDYREELPSGRIGMVKVRMQDIFLPGNAIIVEVLEVDFPEPLSEEALLEKVS